jgi:hypothetical protein
MTKGKKTRKDKGKAIEAPKGKQKSKKDCSKSSLSMEARKP